MKHIRVMPRRKTQPISGIAPQVCASASTWNCFLLFGTAEDMRQKSSLQVDHKASFLKPPPPPARKVGAQRAVSQTMNIKPPPHLTGPSPALTPPSPRTRAARRTTTCRRRTTPCRAARQSRPRWTRPRRRRQTREAGRRHL